VETVFNTFATSYHHALQAVVQKIAKDNLGETTLQLYTTAEQQASNVLETLRHAALLNTSLQHADEVAVRGINLLKQRYASNNMTHIKFPAFTFFPTQMLIVSWLHGFSVNGIQSQGCDPPRNSRFPSTLLSMSFERSWKCRKSDGVWANRRKIHNRGCRRGIKVV
jgi:hypothetical protein